MENSKLFQMSEQGYNCSQVDEYIASLKSEYKKLYDYAKKLDSDSKHQQEKLLAAQAEAERLSTELTLAQSVPAAQQSAGPAETAPEYEALIKSVNTMTILSEEVVRENQELRAKLAAIKAGI